MKEQTWNRRRQKQQRKKKTNIVSVACRSPFVLSWWANFVKNIDKHKNITMVRWKKKLYEETSETSSSASSPQNIAAWWKKAKKKRHVISMRLQCRRNDFEWPAHHSTETLPNNFSVHRESEQEKGREKMRVRKDKGAREKEQTGQRPGRRGKIVGITVHCFIFVWCKQYTLIAILYYCHSKRVVSTIHSEFLVQISLYLSATEKTKRTSRCHIVKAEKKTERRKNNNDEHLLFHSVCLSPVCITQCTHKAKHRQSINQHTPRKKLTCFFCSSSCCSGPQMRKGWVFG